MSESATLKRRCHGNLKALSLSQAVTVPVLLRLPAPTVHAAAGLDILNRPCHWANNLQQVPVLLSSFPLKARYTFCNPPTFPIQNVKLRVKRRLCFLIKFFWLFIACTRYAENPGGFTVTLATHWQRDFQRLKKLTCGRLPLTMIRRDVLSKSAMAKNSKPYNDNHT